MKHTKLLSGLMAGLSLALCLIAHQTAAQKLIMKHDIENPEFVGGTAAYQKFLKDNLIYPPALKQKGVEGNVLVQILIDASGRVSEPKIIKSPHPDFSKEVIRLMTIMPDWIPAIANGTAMNTNYELGISFRLKKKFEEKKKK